MGKKERQLILGQLDESIRPDESVIKKDKDLQTLLKFSYFSDKGKSTKESQLAIQAILVAAVNSGMPLESVAVMKRELLDSLPQRTGDLLKALNSLEATPHEVFFQFMMEIQVGAKLKPVPFEGTVETVPVSLETAQNLAVAQSVNFAVKSIITDGAPNQSSDLLRTSGRNYLLNRELYMPGTKLRDSMGMDKQIKTELRRVNKIDDKRRKKVDLGFGEDFNNVSTKSMDTALIGTGKCAEHASVSFSILSDPTSLAKLGVQLSEGSIVIMARGERIDHTYVLIARPEAIKEISDEGQRRVLFSKPGEVVVVDPWMPIPCAHTLDRANKEIQVNPMSYMVFTVKDGMPILVDRNDQRTPIPPPKIPVIDQLNYIQDTYRPIVLKSSLIEPMRFQDGDSKTHKIVPDNQDVCLVVACGQACVDTIGKAGMYTTANLSTDTPHDLYQVVDSEGQPTSEPMSFFVGDEVYLKKQWQCIEMAQNESNSVQSIGFKPKNLELMPEQLLTSVKDAERGLMELKKKHTNTNTTTTTTSMIEITREDDDDMLTVKVPKVKLREKLKESEKLTTKQTLKLEESDEPKVKLKGSKMEETDEITPKSRRSVRNNPEIARQLSSDGNTDPEKDNNIKVKTGSNSTTTTKVNF
jgi:hypothetical protein